MEQASAINLVKELVHEALLSDGITVVVTEVSSLIGSDSALDSMKLVELCLALEDVASDQNFEFDWTSNSAMSRSQSMFRSIKSLADEFVRQSELGK